MVVLFFSTTILAVVAYRFLPVYITPLMVIRTVEQLNSGNDLVWHHTWIAMSEMSADLPHAVMASEDQRFLHHHGFDYEAIEKAARHNANGGRMHGASTITQQTAKNVFLWPERSWVRKGLETYFTVLIEMLWSKDRIMEVYLNSIEMGNGIYGAQAVAEQHFGKNASELTRSECALIAATLPNPLRFDSSNPTAYMRTRQRQIKQQMNWLENRK